MTTRGYPKKNWVQKKVEDPCTGMEGKKEPTPKVVERGHWSRMQKGPAKAEKKKGGAKF